MKLIPKNVRFRTLLSPSRVLIVSGLVLALGLSIACGAVLFAKEEPAEVCADPERLTGQINAPSVDGEPEEIVVSGNRSYLVHLQVDGEELSCCVDRESEETVLDLLYRNDVYLNAEDEVNWDLSAELEPDMTVKVGRVTYEEVTERESIPYQTTQIMMTYTLSSAVRDSYTKYLKNTAGVPGIREIKTRVKMVDGEPVEYTTLSSEVVSEPKDAVVYVDASYLLNLGNGAPSEVLEVLDCRFTAYTYVEVGGEITATGERTRVGYVAVDRTVIPMHSYLYITLDNGFVYGYCYAKDTGGAIKGNAIDLFLPSLEDCYYFGRKTGKVFILRYGP